MTYRAPVADISFALKNAAGFGAALAEGHSGRVPHFDTGGVERMRQILAAPLRGRGNGVPARLRPCLLYTSPSPRD